jgi:hypothetical protein
MRATLLRFILNVSKRAPSSGMRKQWVNACSVAAKMKQLRKQEYDDETADSYLAYLRVNDRGRGVRHLYVLSQKMLFYLCHPIKRHTIE